MDKKICEISDFEISAIHAALPLVLIYEKEPDKIAMLRKLIDSLSQKLSKDRCLLNSMEQQLIYNSSVLADAALTNDPEFQVDPQVKREISPYFFVYPTLIEKAKKMLDSYA